MIIPLYIPGHWEIILIVLGVLVLFGGKKIPEMMKGVGTGIREFKKGIREEEAEEKTKTIEADKPESKSD